MSWLPDLKGVFSVEMVSTLTESEEVKYSHCNDLYSSFSNLMNREYHHKWGQRIFAFIPKKWNVLAQELANLAISRQISDFGSPSYCQKVQEDWGEHINKQAKQ